MITVIDYGAGNLHSVCNALRFIGADFQIAKTPAELERGSAILLPGVGHFGQMMNALDAAGLAGPLRERLRAGTSYLGICLGLQALFERSEEAPEVRGLGLLAGEVRRFPPGEKVPNMGWCPVDPGGRMYYFAHSYYVPAGVEGGVGAARHGLPFTAILRRDNLAGSQFHPEKSGPAGLEFLKNWVDECRQNG